MEQVLANPHFLMLLRANLSFQVLLLEREFPSPWQLNPLVTGQLTAAYHSGKALAQAGPAPVFIGYTLVGFLCFLVMAALGEVSSAPSYPKPCIYSDGLLISYIRWLRGYHFHLASPAMQRDL